MVLCAVSVRSYPALSFLAVYLSPATSLRSSSNIVQKPNSPPGCFVRSIRAPQAVATCTIVPIRCISQVSRGWVGQQRRRKRRQRRCPPAAAVVQQAEFQQYGPKRRYRFSFIPSTLKGSSECMQLPTVGTAFTATSFMFCLSRSGRSRIQSRRKQCEMKVKRQKI